MARPAVVGSIFLSEHGFETYEAVVETGRADSHRDAIRETFELLAEFQQFVPADASYLSWVAANERFMETDVPFFYQGDWCAGPYNAAESFTHGEDWDVVAFPGTGDVYSIILDGYFTAGAADPAVEDCLGYLGGRDAVETFNRIRGGVPTRSDVDTDELHPFFRQQTRAFERSPRVAKSIAHGASVDADTLIELKIATAEFVSAWDVAAGTSTFVDALGGRT